MPKKKSTPMNQAHEDFYKLLQKLNKDAKEKNFSFVPDVRKFRPLVSMMTDEEISTALSRYSEVQSDYDDSQENNEPQQDESNQTDEEPQDESNQTDEEPQDESNLDSLLFFAYTAIAPDKLNDAWKIYKKILSFFTSNSQLAQIAKNNATNQNTFTTLYPTTYTFPTAKLYNGLPAASAPHTNKKKAQKRKGKFEVIKATKTTPAVTSTVIIDTSNLSGVSGTNNITPIDLSYQNAYITLLLQGNEAITPTMLARVAAGLSPGQNVSPKQIEEADASIKKQMATLLTIDATEEAKAYGKKSGRITGNMIYAKYAEVVSINGKKTSAYLPIIDNKTGIQYPILYQYAAISGQIATVPYDLLQINSVSSSQKNIVLRNYLLLQISGMKHGSLSNKIKYSTIYEHLGMSEKTESGDTSKTWKMETSRVRSAAAKMLEYWKSANFIRGYSTYKKGNTIEGVEVQI